MKGKMKKITTATLLTVALSAGSLVYAAPSEKNVDLQDENIVITVNRAAQEKKTVSDTVDVITRAEIEKSGATDLYGVLKNVGDLNLGQSNKTGHYMRIRGMNTNHTLVLVDGKRMAGEDVSETQNVYTLDRIPLGNVERVEVVKGAASAQYGSDALGGVINIITRDNEKAAHEFTLSTGTKSSTVNYHAATGQIGKFSGDINVNFDDKHKVNNGQGSYLFHGNTKALNFKGKYKVNQYDNIQLDLGYFDEHTKSNMYDIDMHIPEISIDKVLAELKKRSYFGYLGASIGMRLAGLGDAIPAIDGYVRKDQVVYYNNKKYDAALTYNGESDKAIYYVRGYYSKLDKQQELFNHPTVSADLAKKFNTNAKKWKAGIKHMPKAELEKPNVKRHLGMLQSMPSLNPIKYDFDDLKYSVYGAEFNNVIQADDKHTLTYNVDVHRSKVEGTRIDSPDAYDVVREGNGEKVTRQYGHDDLTSMSYYFQDQFQASKKLNMLFGLRYDHDSYFGAKFTPRTGMVFNFDDNNRVKFNYGTAFKAPTLSELYMKRLHNEAGMEFYIYGNPNLRPEESINWDLSYEAEFGKDKASYGKVTYFNNRVKNLIFHEVDGALTKELGQLAYHYINKSRADIRGVELSLGRKLSKTWSTKLNYTWLSPRDGITHERLDENAAQSGSLQFLYDDNKEKGWSGALSSNLMRDYKFNKAPERPGSKAEFFTYNTIDLTVNRKFGKGNHAFFGVDNLFNVKRDTIGITGRMWRVGSQWTF